jgi:hypothetical protein
MTTNPEPINTLVTERDDAPADGTRLTTTDTREADVIIRAMTPFAQVLVRFARTYLQGLVGFLLLGLAAKPTLEGLGVAVPVDDFFTALKVAAGLALAPAVIALLQNLIELLAKLDEKFPKMRA